jgi:hypothetical protein
MSYMNENRGRFNLAVGYHAFYNATTESNCIAIGTEALSNSPFVCQDCGVTSAAKRDGWLGVDSWVWCADCKKSHATPEVLDRILATMHDVIKPYDVIKPIEVPS